METSTFLENLGFTPVNPPNAAAVVRKLKSLGVERVIMITGDNERVAKAIAKEVGVDAYYADLLPDFVAGQLIALGLHAQALCDQMGQALQRVASTRAEREAQAQAQLQAVRNALLAAISHDYRTPLATILGAASSLADQDERLQPAQRQRLARQIVAEVTHLSQLTDNTLQLARLDAPGVQLRLDDGMVVELGRQQPKVPVRLRLQRFVEHYPAVLSVAKQRPSVVDMRYPNGFALRVAAAQVHVTESKGKQ